MHRSAACTQLPPASIGSSSLVDGEQITRQTQRFYRVGPLKSVVIAGSAESNQCRSVRLSLAIPLLSSNPAAIMGPADAAAGTTTTRDVYIVASGDLRKSANVNCWPAQKAMEAALTQALQRVGFTVKRAHPFVEADGHGFISTQRQGMDVFGTIPKDAPVVVAVAVWQYSYHVLPGLYAHRGAILTVANWSGEWPGLVGLLNLNAGLVKMGKAYSSLWSQSFAVDDAPFTAGLEAWAAHGAVAHDTSHVADVGADFFAAAAAFSPATRDAVATGRRLADEFMARQAIIGTFDEGCMGMYNAHFDDDILMRSGVFKEPLSQSALVHEMSLVTDDEARAVYDWTVERGLTYRFGADPATELTLPQVLSQCRMYVAAIRIAGRFGCDAIGIQYQQGLKDTCPASDLAEGLMNNDVRPPVYRRDSSGDSGEELFAGGPVVHYNEVDQGCAVDALVTNRVWRALDENPSTTLHDIRWGEEYAGAGFVWTFEISGSAPASHFADGYRSAVSERQPQMYFPLGGGSLKGCSKPGVIVWSRVFEQGRALHADAGIADIVRLPEEETERRWAATTPQWPIMHAVLRGITRDQMMARHRSNHIQVAYASDEAAAQALLVAKVAMFERMNITPHVCGDGYLNHRTRGGGGGGDGGATKKRREDE